MPSRGPTEAWLERQFPLWRDELAQREARTHVLRCRMASMAKTSAASLPLDQQRRLEEALVAQHAEIYIARARQLAANDAARSQRPALLTLRVKALALDVAGIGGREDAVVLAQSLDESPVPTVTGSPAPRLARAEAMVVSVALSSMQVRIRRFLQPLASIGSIVASGRAALVQKETLPELDQVRQLHIGPRRVEGFRGVVGVDVEVRRTPSPPKLFYDFAAEVRAAPRAAAAATPPLCDPPRAAEVRVLTDHSCPRVRSPALRRRRSTACARRTRLGWSSPCRSCCAPRAGWCCRRSTAARACRTGTLCGTCCTGACVPSRGTRPSGCSSSRAPTRCVAAVAARRCARRRR